MRRVTPLLVAGCLAGAGALAVIADAALVEPYRLTTTRVEIPAGRLADALAGDRIVHLSDLHLRGFGRREEKLAAILRAEDPTLIVMTGDYADTTAGIAALGELLGRVHPLRGIIAVPGNNDYFRGRQEAIFAALRSSGALVLRNTSTLLAAAGGRIAIAGVDDPFFGRDDVAAALSGIPAGVPTLFLAHSPAVMEARSEGMLFNAGDASGAWGAGWFWMDGSHLRGPQPALRFESGGEHVVRVQRREDGAGLGEIRLIPAAEPGIESFASSDHGAPPHAEGEITIDPCGAGRAELHGSWTRAPIAPEECALLDGPDRGRLESYPRSDPADYADIRFSAPTGVAYRIWVRIYSPASTGRSDSIYLQFGDGLDEEGRPRFRIGSEREIPRGPAVGLVLAGHTHGGQVRLPLLGALEGNISGGPFVMGRYDIGGTMLYISRGVGTSYLPVRFDCAPEVVVLTPGRSEERGGPRA